MAEQPFDCIPGRVGEASVLVEASRIARQMIHRRQGQWQRDGIALRKFGAAEMGKARGARLRRFGHGLEPIRIVQ